MATGTRAKAGKAKGAAPAEALSLGEARAILIGAQGLARPAGGGVAAVLERHGFVRTLGGIEAYVALRARAPGLAAKEVHAALEAGEARVIPAVRGCMYVVGAAQTGPALRLAGALSLPRQARDIEKSGIREGEVEKLSSLVVKALEAKGPLTTDALRRALPEGSVRSLGEQGKKVGVSSPLPLALRALELERRIERATEGGRLDTERYLWRALSPSARPERSATAGGAGSKGKGDKAASLDPLPAIAELYLRAAGIGTLAELSEWAGVSQRDARAALEGLPVVSVAVEGIEGERLMLEESRAHGAKAAAQAAREAVALLPFEDNLFALPGFPALLVDAAHMDMPVPTWGMGGKTAPLGSARHSFQRTVVAEGRLAGFWDWDPDAEEVALGLLGEASKATARRISEEADALGAFIRDELGGNGRCFCLDTEDELRKRSAWVRGLSGGGGKKAPPPSKARKAAKK